DRLIKGLNAQYLLGIILIIISAFTIMGIMTQRTATDPEALGNFRFMRELTLGDIWTDETVPGHFVTFRPVKQSMLRIGYLLFGLNPPVFFSLNLLLLCVVAGLIYEHIYRRTGEIFPALIAALFFITDWRLTPNIYVIGEVQITLAAIFGLLALWIIWYGKGNYKPAKVFLLLLCSVLSKEFGLAFALAVFMDALIYKEKGWKTFVGVALGVVTVFMGIRLLMDAVPASVMSYSSFFNRIKWYFYNISSGFVFTFINIFRPGNDGDLPSVDNLQYTIPEAWHIVLFQIIPIVLFFILGFRKKEAQRVTLPLLFLLVGNSILFFWRYAYRFHFLGDVGMYIIMGFGIHYIFRKLGQDFHLPNAIYFCVLLMGSILFWRGQAFSQSLHQMVRWSDRGICSSESGFSSLEIGRCLQTRGLCIPTDEYYSQENVSGYYRATDQETVRLVMEYYQIPITYCACLDPYPVCK
ncbi:MAG: hypothetical protein MUO62_00350, partial [Anaerolineales bacterium]|nr:hypothetical protein [Anaerolineales bacterium]